MSTEERLTNFLNHAKDWERRATSISGVFLLKLPSYRTRQASVGILSNPKLSELTVKIDEVNPKQKDAAAIGGGTDIFEI